MEWVNVREKSLLLVGADDGVVRVWRGLWSEEGGATCVICGAEAGTLASLGLTRVPAVAAAVCC